MFGPATLEYAPNLLRLARGHKYYINAMVRLLHQDSELLCTDELAGTVRVFKEQEVAFLLDCFEVVTHGLPLVVDSMARYVQHLWFLAKHEFKILFGRNFCLEVDALARLDEGVLDGLCLFLEVEGWWSLEAFA